MKIVANWFLISELDWRRVVLSPSSTGWLYILNPVPVPGELLPSSCELGYLPSSLSVLFHSSLTIKPPQNQNKIQLYASKMALHKYDKQCHNPKTRSPSQCKVRRNPEPRDGGKEVGWHVHPEHLPKPHEVPRTMKYCTMVLICSRLITWEYKADVKFLQW